MQQASATWKEGMSFSGTADSVFTVAMSGSAAAGGAEDGFRPTELVLVGLAGCTGIDVMSILKKKRQTVTGLEVKVSAVKASEVPTGFTAIQIHYVVTGHEVAPAAVAQAVQLSAEKYCSVSAMLEKTAVVEHTLEVLAAN